jgi:hypothetical protein
MNVIAASKVKLLNHAELNIVNDVSRGSVMNGVDDGPERGRCLNAVALQNAVLCAECDVVSDSPHDTCLVCGSRSLFNIARVFGGNLPQNRTVLVPSETMEMRHEVVLSFPSNTSAGSRQAVSLYR